MEYNDSMGSFVPFVASLLIDFRNDACKSYLHTRKCTEILPIPFYAIEMDERKKTLSHFAVIARSALVNAQTYLYIGKRKLSFRSSRVEQRERGKDGERERRGKRKRWSEIVRILLVLSFQSIFLAERFYRIEKRCICRWTSRSGLEKIGFKE